MRTFYSIRITTTENNYQLISNTLNLEINKYDQGWIYEVEVDENESYFNFINNFLSILEPHFNELERLGVKRENISFWIIYEYDNECNLEFDPEGMKRLGENEISLCISCYQG